MAELIAQPRQDRASLGIVMMLAAWFLFSVVDTSVKWLVLLGLPAFQLAFMRYFVHFILSIAAVARADSLFGKSTPNQMGLLLLRAGLLVSATVLNFIALKYLPLTTIASIMFSSPIIVSALSVPLLGERVGPWRWLAIMLGFVGVLVVIRPFGAEFHWASALIVYNATALGLFSIITRKLAGAVPAQTMQIYMGAVGTLVLMPMAIWTWTNPETPLDWILMVGIGFWAWLGHDIFSRAHGYAPASALMPFAYSFIIYMALLSYLVFGDLPDTATILGAAIIVVSGLLIWWRENLRRSDHAAN